MKLSQQQNRNQSLIVVVTMFKNNSLQVDWSVKEKRTTLRPTDSSSFTFSFTPLLFSQTMRNFYLKLSNFDKDDDSEC